MAKPIFLQGPHLARLHFLSLCLITAGSTAPYTQKKKKMPQLNHLFTSRPSHCKRQRFDQHSWRLSPIATVTAVGTPSAQYHHNSGCCQPCWIISWLIGDGTNWLFISSLLDVKVRKHITDLYEDLRDGHNLISLLEVLSGVNLVWMPLHSPTISHPDLYTHALTRTQWIHPVFT